MKYFIGLDVSMEETSICIVDQDGKIIKESITISNPNAIHKFICNTKLEIEKIALESGSLSNWLSKKLLEKGLPVVCVDARHIAAILKMTINKTDRNDAKGIANAVRCNMYREVYIKSNNSVEKSTLLGARECFSTQKTCFTNTIRGLFKGYGIRLSGSAISSSNKETEAFFKEAKKEAEKLSETVEFSLKELITHAEILHKKVKEFDRKITEMVKDDKEVQLLQSVGGVGPVTALMYTMVIDDPKRFEKSRSVGAYLGMTPTQYSSGEIQRQGRISKCGPGPLRRLLRQAGTFVLTRSNKNSKLKAWGLKLKAKIGGQKAAMAMGRKLAVIMHRMLITGKEFEYEEEQLLGKKLRTTSKKTVKRAA
jgi:transposase